MTTIEYNKRCCFGLLDLPCIGEIIEVCNHYEDGSEVEYPIKVRNLALNTIEYIHHRQITRRPIEH